MKEMGYEKMNCIGWKALEERPLKAEHEGNKTKKCHITLSSHMKTLNVRDENSVHSFVLRQSRRKRQAHECQKPVT